MNNFNVISNADIKDMTWNSDGTVTMIVSFNSKDTDGDHYGLYDSIGKYSNKFLNDWKYDYKSGDIYKIGKSENNHAYKIPKSVPQVQYISEEENNTVVVRWTDGTVTVVKCSENDKPDLYSAFCAALAKKIYGTTSAVYREIDKHNVTTINAANERAAAKEQAERVERERINHDRKIRRLAKRMREEREANNLLKSGENE